MQRFLPKAEMGVGLEGLKSLEGGWRQSCPLNSPHLSKRTSSCDPSCGYVAGKKRRRQLETCGFCRSWTIDN